jgi:peptidase M1-like protein
MIRKRLLIWLVVVCWLLAACTAPALTPTLTEQPASVKRATPALPLADQRLAMREGSENDIDKVQGVPFYLLDMTLSTDPLLIEGHETVYFTNSSTLPLNSIVFRLPVNGLAGERLEEVTDLKADGNAIEPLWSVSDSVLRLPLEKPLPPGETTPISMSFNLTLPEDFEVSYGRIGDQGGVIALASFVPMLSVYRDGQWWEEMPVPLGDPAFSETAFFDVTLKAPQDEQIASSGVVISQEEDGKDTRYHIVTGPVRDFALLLSTEFETVSKTEDGVKVTVWSSPGDHQADEEALDKTLIALHIYDEKFGEYPFKELDVVETPITAGGIEYPGLIYIASDVWDPSDFFFEVVISHEVAHQWWYSMVGNDQISEPWLDEALANYSVEVYYRESLAPAAGDNVRSVYQQRLDDYLDNGSHKNMPVDLPVSTYDERAYSVFVYQKGALFYSHLADDYGQDKVYAFLRAYYNRFQYKVATTDDLRRMVGEFFGDKGARFFDEWIKGQSQ